jgi:hypothetical protein
VITRRQLLVRGLTAGAVLALAGLAYECIPERGPGDPRYRFAFLDDEDRAIVAAIAPVMLAGALRGSDAVMHVVRGTDVAIAGLPPAVQAQLRQLFGILRFPPARMLAAGIWRPWHEASQAQVAHFLQSWRYSPITTLRGAYDAMHQLVMAAWYGSDASWPATGYPGPPSVRA